MRTTVFSTAIVALLMATRSLLSAPSDDTAANLPAAAAKPVAVVSFAGYEALMEDIALVGQLSDHPDLDRGLEAMLKLFTKNRGLAGLDKSRPWGVAVHTTDGEDFPGYLFIPVTNPAELADVLQPYLGTPEEVSDGVFKLEHEGDPVYAAPKKGDWVFLSDKPENLADTPADPASLLGDMPENYDLAVKVHVANVPEHLKKEFVEKVRKDTKRDLAQRPGEDDREYLVRKKVTKAVARAITGAADEIDQIMLGWNLDADLQRAFLDLNVVAKPGTNAAKEMAELKGLKTNMAGFQFPEAALAAHWSRQESNSPANDITEIFAAVRSKALSDIDEESKPEHEKEAARMLACAVIDAVEKSELTGKSNGGLAVLLSESQATLLAGAYVADPSSLEEAVRKLAAKAVEQEPKLKPYIKLDAETFKGVELHTMNLPIPDDADDREKVVSLVGEELDVVVGIGKQAIYFGIGRDATTNLKTAIAESAKNAGSKLPPAEIAVSLKPLAEFIGAVGKPHERPKAKVVAEVLEKMVGKDHVRLVAKPIPNGVRVQVEMEEGVLRLMGKANDIKREVEAEQLSITQ